MLLDLGQLTSELSSGKHIELAVRQLREKVAEVTAIAWIGD